MREHFQASDIFYVERHHFIEYMYTRIGE